MKTADHKHLELAKMTVDDIPGVQVVERHSFTTPWSLRALVSEITENECAHYMVLRNRGQVIGYIGMWIILDEGHITNIAVHPTWRRQGIGSQLLIAMGKHGYARGVRRLTLEVRKSNATAQAMYTKFGFESVGIRPKYYLDNAEDAVIMWKELKSDEFESDFNTRNRDKL